MNELTAEQYLQLAYEDPTNDGEVNFICTSCKEPISNYDGLVSPCHPEEGFVEGSGHGGLSGMHIYCVYDSPGYNCTWGGPVAEYEPQLLCCLCRKSPFLQ